MRTIESEFGLWVLRLKSSESLLLSFYVPSDRRRRIERHIRLALKVVYVAYIGWSCLDGGLGLTDTFFAFAILLPLIPFASFIRRTACGDNHFVPFLIEIDGSKQIVEMIDPRSERRASVHYKFSEIKAVFLNWQTGPSGVLRIVFQFSDGVAVRLPLHGPGSSGQLLEPILERLPSTVADRMCD